MNICEMTALEISNAVKNKEISVKDAVDAFFAAIDEYDGKYHCYNTLCKKEAYERGKEYYYSQRGYLKLSCATCHIQGSGQRVRNEVLSPLLGQVTHFPVLRLKWTDIGTVERRLSGCVVDQGQVPPKDESQTMIELLYFLAYMSNDMPVDGPDVRK